MGLRGRHDLVWIRRKEAPDEFASPWIPGNHGHRTALPRSPGALGCIEAQARLAGLGVRPVARKAGVGEYGKHIPRESHPRIGRHRASNKNQQNQTLSQKTEPGRLQEDVLTRFVP